jgi:predicted component of type VI protein secretion system
MNDRQSEPMAPHPHPDAAGTAARAHAAVPNSFGELQPVGGGDPIPLLKSSLVIGRRESSDIVLRFPNVSGTHCELTLSSGHWFVKDLGSSNGTKINGTRVSEGRLDPGDKVSIGRHEYEVCYDPGTLGSDGGAPRPLPQRDIFSRSLLASAGLEGRRGPRPGRQQP